MTPDWRAVVVREIPSLRDEPEILDELSQHLADVYERGLADGLSPEAALALATDALPVERDRLPSDLARARTALPGLIADRWTTAALDATEPAPDRASVVRDFGRDVIYALRSLRAAPGYAIVSLLTLAIGIGANAALFAAVDTILLRPMPYAHADRLVVPVSVNRARDLDDASVSFADYLDWQKETGTFAAAAIWRPITVDLTGAGDPQRILGMQVAPEFFTVLTMTPVLGRTLQPADHAAEAPRVAVLSHALWQRAFAGAADVVGRSIGVAGVPHEIVGVLPPRESWPENAALFVPLRPALADADTRTRRDNLIFASIARLQDGVSVEQANAVVAGIAARLERDHPEARKGWTNRVVPLRDQMVDDNLRRALWVMLAAVGAVLLIGCANLAHLGLLRGLGRAPELGVRVALGASRWRIVRQLAVESVLLAFAGAAAGAGLAAWMIQGLKVIAPAGTPFVADLGLDLRVLAATTTFASIAVIVSGLVPAIAVSRAQPEASLRATATAAGTSRRVRVLRQALIIAEVAGAVVLLVGAALLLRSFSKLQHVDSGVDVDRVIAARLSLPNSERYATAAQSAAFFQRLEERLRTIPGVEAVGSTSFVPIGGGGFGLGRVFLLEGWPEPPAGPDVSAQWNVVTPDYFRAVGMPILDGRAFTAEDRADSTPVMIVSRSFARQMFGSERPLGRRVRSWRDENVLREIVGVVGEVRYTGLGEREVFRQMYVPHTQSSWGLMNIVVRSAGPAPGTLEAAMRADVRALDSTLAVSDVRTFDSLARASIAGERYTTLLLSGLAATALALGAVGIYGVIGHAVSMRRRELGLRAALGASPSQLRALAIGEGVRLTAVGLVIGLAGAFVVARVLERLLYETDTRDPFAYAVTATTIAVVATLASIGPARRAANVDPISTLRMP
ncbi:MAG TPA: ABC transporter permease [Vicinamibacterales bacterium]|nr:ABC transporter permease [Vicinamibacterales bacterium]